MFRINPLTIEKYKRFKSIKRGYYSFIILSFVILFSLAGELFVNSRALVVKYQGSLFFPTYGPMIPGKEFGLDYEYETNYRELKEIFSAKNNGDFVLLPPVPYNAFETDKIGNSYPPYPPSFKKQHYLGTDKTGRDVVARLLYGFRIAILFSLLLLLFNYVIGIAIGSLMGYLGGRFDLFFQRVIEIWNNIPFLYAIIIIASILIPSFFSLLGIMIFFGWIGITWYVRTATYREREREYVLARNMCFYILQKYFKMTLKEIGRTFHRDHTTAIHGIRMFHQDRQVNEQYEQDYENIKQILDLRENLELTK